MTNFSSFFPVAGGGGGFTKMKKYSTARAANDSTNKLDVNVSGKVGAAISGGGQTSFQWYLDDTDAAQTAIATTANALVGYTFSIGYGTQTVTANTGAAFGTNQTLSFTPAVAGGVSYNTITDLNAPTSFTVNPATDLGLSDGDSIGFLLAGGNRTGVLRGTRIISNASTNLVITPGLASGTASTITGGLTLTSADGSTDSSYSSASVSVTGYRHHGSSGGNGVDGYGTGSQYSSSLFKHGWGGSGMDGAVLLYY